MRDVLGGCDDEEGLGQDAVDTLGLMLGCG
jgi:hypothetical protein